MKIVRRTPESAPVAAPPPFRHNWKVLVVDDEPDVRAVTRLALRDFAFAGRGLELLEAGSASQARECLAAHPDIALALIDVVMETDDAGLKLVEHIRGELANSLMRLVVRTGQPGAAPERFVIDHYDIDDYKDKTELTSTRLYTSVRSGIKAYRDLNVINVNRLGLESILEATPALFQIGGANLGQFFSGVLTQIIGLCQLSQASHIGTFEGVISTLDDEGTRVRASTGGLSDSRRFLAIQEACERSLRSGELAPELREHAKVLPLTIGGRPVGYIYIEPIEPLSADDLNLIQIMARQCSHALENFKLHGSLLQAYDNAIDMLAEIAEFKDKTTGGHINRIDHYTRQIALALGIPDEEATRYGKASRLHDVGKIGIPDHLLVKPGKLTPEEFEVMKTHTTIGASILAHDEAFDLSRDVALHHHERWEGGGYPDGTPSAGLPLVTRIVSVVDVFDALVSPRPYKGAWTPQAARAVIAEGAGTQFDPAVVAAFLRLLDRGDFDDVVARTAAA